jgi:guanylate kinase
MRRSGILFLISAPSGAGKTTLCDNLRKQGDFVYSVSSTTRAPRPNEQDGKDYEFIQEELFKKRIQEGYFLEHAQVHGNWYGTPLNPVKMMLAKGQDVLLDIDVQGAAQIRAQRDEVIRRALVDVFLMTETFAELERRLRKRATESEEVIQRRLKASTEEMKHWREYTYVIFSTTAQEDVNRFRAVVQAERFRASRLNLDDV